MVRHLLLLCVGAPAGGGCVGVCAPLPGKAYFSVEGRKLFAGKRRRRLREFAPPSRESLILPSRGANPSPGRAAAGCGSLRPTPGKALFFRRGAQTFHREEPPPAAGVCASLPGKPYSSVEGRKPFTRKSPRRPWEFAPHSRESLILPLRGANPSPGKAPAAVRVCAPFPGKPYFSVEGRKPFTRKSPRRPWEFAPHSRESLILPLRSANPAPGKGAGGCVSLRPIPRKGLFFR